MIWTKDIPRLDDAWYWWKPKGATNDKAIPVYINRRADEFHPEDYTDAEWSHCPIPYPEESNIEDR